jgi:hypothetical protein
MAIIHAIVISEKMYADCDADDYWKDMEKYYYTDITDKQAEVLALIHFWDYYRERSGENGFIPKDEFAFGWDKIVSADPPDPKTVWKVTFTMEQTLTPQDEDWSKYKGKSDIEIFEDLRDYILDSLKESARVNDLNDTINSNCDFDKLKAN